MNDTALWRASPSQWSNFGVYFLSVLLCWLIVPVFYAIWVWIVTKNEAYELNEQSLTLYSGVLNQRVDDVQLYRVKDIRLDRPLGLRLFGLGNISLITSDQNNPYIILRAVKDSEALRKQIRSLVEQSRNRRGVREVDAFGDNSIF